MTSVSPARTTLEGPALRAVGRSWLSMKTWVKVWLFFLNGVFLAGFAFLEDPLGAWALAAYAGSGFLLFPMMVVQRGLTRLLGLAHLIPWTPLLVYLELRLTTDWAGPRIDPGVDGVLFAWAVVLWVSLVICLGFDVWDAIRWVRGERFVLGSPEAAAAGASRLARPDGAT